MKSNLRNEIKSYIVRSGCTMQEVVDLFLQEQEEGTQAGGGMVPSGEHPRSHYLKEGL